MRATFGLAATMLGFAAAAAALDVRVSVPSLPRLPYVPLGLTSGPGFVAELWVWGIQPARELELEQRFCEWDGVGGRGGHERSGVHAVHVHQRRCQRLERPV